MKVTFAILGFVAIVAAGLFFRAYAMEAAAWRALSERVPAHPLTPEETEVTFDGLSVRTITDGDQVGHIRLANGDIWRFAFRSHHHLAGPDSFSIFSGPTGAFQVRGDYFCCEVQFPGRPVSKDSNEFLALLRSVHKSVEPAKGQ
jgi:hypothetical protein